MADNITTSRIATVRDSYGRFMDFLPDESNDNAIAQELNDARIQLNEVLTEDGTTLDNLLTQSNFRFLVADFESPQLTIRRSFLMRNEPFNRESERIQYFLGQWRMSRDVLDYLAGEMINLLPAIRAEFNESTPAGAAPATTAANNMSTQQQRQRQIIAFIHMTRGYHDFIGCAANIQDVIIDYEEVFDFLVTRIRDPNHPFQPRRLTSDISHTELLAGVRELLLRGNRGRFTPPPLLRSALEVIITRTLLNPNYSGRYRGHTVEVQPDFEMADILRAVNELQLRFTISTEAVRRMYEWGNISTHRGWRMRHTEIWYLLVAIQQITQQGIVEIPDDQVSQTWDNILDALIERGVIRIV
jgi:hypothetical protein